VTAPDLIQYKLYRSGSLNSTMLLIFLFNCCWYHQLF